MTSKRSKEMANGPRNNRLLKVLVCRMLTCDNPERTHTTQSLHQYVLNVIIQHLTRNYLVFTLRFLVKYDLFNGNE